ncbi:MAG: sulfatase activating formylglycine-generating enzyme, partial [Myxococcota bacterium]
SVTLGRSATSPYYGWDNEFGQRPAQVAPFEAARYLVSNADWLSFVRAGGYDDRALWSTEALQWRDGAAHHGPKFWVADATRPDGYAYRAMFDLLDLPLAWPAEVNAHEAAAYCRWRGEDWRLPTEAEHRALVGDCGDPCRVEVGQHRNLNLNMALGSPSAVDAHPDDAGICHAVGNVWQWLSEPMRPFDGFRPHPLYDDFTAPYFDDHHALMTGGAWASTGTSCSPWYRNWFRKHFYQHVGFRIVRSLEK